MRRRNVVHLVESLANRPGGEPLQYIRVPFSRSPGVECSPQPCDDAERSGALVGREIAIARGEGEPVEFPHDRAADHLDWDVEVTGEARENLPLLVVLAPEDSHRPASEVEELGHDRGDAIEMGLSKFALERLSHLRYAYLSLEALRVHRIGFRREHEIDPTSAAPVEVALEGSRVAIEVFAFGELQGVHEHGHRDELRPSLGLVDQREVAFMKRAHRRHQADDVAALTSVFACLPKLGGLADEGGHPLGPYAVRAPWMRLSPVCGVRASSFFTFPKLYSALGNVPARTSSR